MARERQPAFRYSDPTGGVPARPQEVPGLWPLGRPRGPPRRQTSISTAWWPRCPPYPYQAQTNAPYVRGRLVIIQLGDGPFTVERHPRG
jgi:hypothetical protein